MFSQDGEGAKYIYIYTCMYVCMYVRMYVCMYVSLYVCMYVRMYAGVCIYIYTINMHVEVTIYINSFKLNS